LETGALAQGQLKAGTAKTAAELVEQLSTKLKKKEP
jgi:hypothetical protein